MRIGKVNTRHLYRSWKLCFISRCNIYVEEYPSWLLIGNVKECLTWSRWGWKHIPQGCGKGIWMNEKTDEQNTNRIILSSAKNRSWMNWQIKRRLYQMSYKITMAGILLRFFFPPESWTICPGWWILRLIYLFIHSFIYLSLRVSSLSDYFTLHLILPFLLRRTLLPEFWRRTT